MYSYLTNGTGVPDSIPELLSEAFRLKTGEVDVSESSEWEDRNWDARVTCEYTESEVGLRWSLTIYAADDVEHQPSEGELGLMLALRLSASVFFEWDRRIPWVRQVALADGRFTLARVTGTDQESAELSVTAAEAPLPDFPGCPVTHFPEVVRLHGLPTPVTDSLASPEETGQLGDLRGLLVNWERLCVRMTTGWPPGGWYSTALYREDLELRDQLEAGTKDLPASESQRLTAALRGLDDVYRAATVDDQGVWLSTSLHQGRDGWPDRPWYWQRRPAALRLVHGGTRQPALVHPPTDRPRTRPGAPADSADGCRRP
jgi:hypothetical protein